jgi:periplasmic copper chaperone A
MKETRTMHRTLPALVLAALLVAPSAAQAHVTLQPSTAPAGGFTRLDVRVPNEKEDAATTEVDVQLPAGFEFASYEPVPGWTVKVTRSGEEVSRITWTGDGEQGVVEPGQFQDFGLSLRMPEGEAGEKLTFKALQTYDDGEVVRWIGPEDADEPAPIVTLEPADAAAGGHSEPAAAGTDAAQGAAATEDGGSDTLATVALVVGTLGLLAALAALVGTRRRRRVAP